MITASEPVEFIPRGRQAVEEHGGPLVIKKQQQLPVECMLLSRMQNVTLSTDNPNEFWQIQDVSAMRKSLCNSGPTTGGQAFNEKESHQEDELYVKGHTAVWTQGLSAEHQMPRVCLTCESTIKFAFFCPPSFISALEPIEADEKNFNYGIGLLDGTCLKVYFKNGEDYVTAIENPISKVWVTRQALLMEKDPSNATVENLTVPMPRLFSLTHPLAEMSPILIKTQMSCNYLVEADYKIIYSSYETDLVLMFDLRIGKHFVCRLRKATPDEIQLVSGMNDTLNGTPLNVTSNTGLHSLSGHHHSFSKIKHNNTGLFKSANVSSVHHHQSTLSLSDAGTFVSLSRTPIGSPLRNLQNSMFNSCSYQTLRKFDQIEPSKPIVPELCLEIIWTDNSGTRDFNEEASHGFIHTDLIGQSYLCYLLPHTYKLNLARMEKSHTPDTQVFGIVTSVSAKDAVELKDINMIAVLAPCGNVMLYSGPYLTGKIHIGGILSGLTTPSSISTSFSSFPRRSSLLPMSRHSTDCKFDEELHMLSPVLPLHPVSTNSSTSKTNCQELRDATGTRLTLVYPGKMYRVSVPSVCESVLVTKCLEALRQVLQKELAIHLIIKWYGTRNAPGTKDFSPLKEWNLFMSMLYEQIGRPCEEFDSGEMNEPNMEDVSTENSHIKRRKSDLIHGTDADWKFLLNVHPSVQPDPRDIENRPLLIYKPETPLFTHIPLIFYTFHLLYEDLKLDTSLSNEIKQLAQLLHQLSIDLNLNNFGSHYVTDFPELVRNDRKAVIKEPDAKKLLHTQFYFGSDVPNLFKFVYTVICGVATNPYPYIKDLNVTSKNVAQVMSLIFERATDLSTCVKKIVPPGGRHELASNVEKKRRVLYDETTSLPHKIIYHLIDMGITRKKIQSFPVAIHFILAQSLENSRRNPPIGCSSHAYKLLLRRELTEHATVLQKIEDDDQKEGNVFESFKESSISLRKRQRTDVIIVKQDKKQEEDGMENTDTALLRLRFPNDLRINTVRNFLNSSKPVTIDIAQLPSVSDHEFIEEQEKQLFSLCIRTMALSIGRGMFTIRTTTPSCTESLSIPKLCLSGKEVNRGATIELQQIEVPANMTTWPQFHNGLAAGLKISSESKDVDSTWIIYNKPKTNSEQSSDHAGFLMALGLNGHLRTLSFMSIYEYLVKCDEMTNIGLLLGISATHRGTQDLKTTKLLSVHIEALLPPTAVELDIPQNIQVASLMGIGLVYQGTAKRHIAEVLLQEIGRPPGPEMENYVERESYALTAGLALGLVTLGLGEESTGLRDLGLSDTLHYYMVGGNKRPLGGAQKDKYKLPSFQIREGDTVNIDVTAPGATLALGLMFFNTGNEAVANWMKPPDTKFLLDFIRPDLLQLRIIAKGLIMWNKIQPTTEWINSNVPSSLASLIKERPDPDDINIEIDHEANCQAYCNIITGAAVCIGLRYAGTNDEKAFNTLKKVIDFFLNINTQWAYISEFTGKATIESCAIMALLSLSLVCAGSGDLTLLKIIRMMRSRIGTSYSQVTYGSHIAIHMALGFLFLGAGRYTLSRTPEAIAALVISLFPKFPNHSSDNRYHLQAFRHLYVLAIEPRLFLTRDIDTGKLALCNLVYVNLAGQKEAVAPCMLPELDSLKTVQIEDSSYWPVYFDRQRNWDQLVKILQKSGCIDIKQRAGCFSHLEDPNRLKTLLSQTLTEEQFKAWKINPKSLLSFSNDENIFNFTQKFIFPLVGSEVRDLGPASPAEDSLVQKLILLAYNCLTKDKMHALSIYVNLLDATRDLRNSTNPQQFVWQLKIIAKILEMYKHVNEDDFLLSYEILSSILISIKLRIENLVKEREALLKEFLKTNDVMLLRSVRDEKELNEIVTILVFYGIALDERILPQGAMNKLQVLAHLKKVGLDSEAITFVKNLFQI